MADKQPKEDATAKRAQELRDVEEEQGFRGTKTDPTPNEAYTVAGVTNNPEQAAEAARTADATATKAGENQ